MASSFSSLALRAWSISSFVFASAFSVPPAADTPLASVGRACARALYCSWTSSSPFLTRKDLVASASPLAAASAAAPSCVPPRPSREREDRALIACIVCPRSPRARSSEPIRAAACRKACASCAALGCASVLALSAREAKVSSEVTLAAPLFSLPQPPLSPVPEPFLPLQPFPLPTVALSTASAGCKSLPSLPGAATGVNQWAGTCGNGGEDADVGSLGAGAGALVLVARSSLPCGLLERDRAGSWAAAIAVCNRPWPTQSAWAP
mmetsp:Transcript_139625/g.389452  ORF Transcript_139625/g.389452 Transcript_139625/m.389452 type:complete len:265 (+) Transcript_139625:219-1013(+)